MGKLKFERAFRRAVQAVMNACGMDREIRDRLAESADLDPEVMESAIREWLDLESLPTPVVMAGNKPEDRASGTGEPSIDAIAAMKRVPEIKTTPSGISVEELEYTLRTVLHHANRYWDKGMREVAVGMVKGAVYLKPMSSMALKDKEFQAFCKKASNLTFKLFYDTWTGNEKDTAEMTTDEIYNSLVEPKSAAAEEAAKKYRRIKVVNRKMKK